MVSYSPTMAAIRFGYGLSPHEKQGARLDDMLGQLADGSRAQPMFPRGGIDEARPSKTEYPASRAPIDSIHSQPAGRKMEVDYRSGQSMLREPHRPDRLDHNHLATREISRMSPVTSVASQQRAGLIKNRSMESRSVYSR